MASEDNILFRLLDRGFYAKELPPVFRCVGYSESICEARKILRTQDEFIGNTVYFDGLKFQGQHRMFGVVHPISYALLCDAISENWNRIHDILSMAQSSAFPISFPPEKEARGRSFCRPNFAAKERSLDSLSSSYPYILSLDINRFYGSVYSHSIPWAALGKDAALLLHESKSLDAEWSAKLDKRVRACNRNQTIGLPIGPDTSRIISELILSRIDLGIVACKAVATTKQFHHIIDDYSIGVMSVEEGERVSALFEREIRKFELRTREDKRSIATCVVNQNSAWRARLNLLESLSGLEFLDALFAEVANQRLTHPNANVLGYSLARYKSILTKYEYRETTLQHLQRLIYSFPWLIQWVAPFFVGLKQNDDLTDAQIRMVAFGISESSRRHDVVSVLWFLYLFLNFDLNLSKELYDDCLRLDSVLVDLMLAHCDQNDLLSGDIELLKARHISRNLDSSSWLYLYETEIRGWSAAPANKKIDKKLNATLEGRSKSKIANPEAFFTYMQARDVHFYDISAFGVDEMQVNLKGDDFKPSEQQAWEKALGLSSEGDAAHDETWPYSAMQGSIKASRPGANRFFNALNKKGTPSKVAAGEPRKLEEGEDAKKGSTGIWVDNGSAEEDDVADWLY